MLTYWFPDAIIRLGPARKQGYHFYRGYMNVSLCKGACVHSLEGPYRAGLSVLDGQRDASWGMTLRKVGPPVQHYPANVITWHCGRYGDDVGLYAGNASLFGIEVEGVAGEPMTDNQVHWLIEVLKWYWQLNKLGEPSRPEQEQVFPYSPKPIILDDELWEHREIVATSCPSDRIPWESVIEGMTAVEGPSEWEQYTKHLQQELQYFVRVADLAFAIEQKRLVLVAVWRRSSDEPPLDHAVFSEVRGLCQQMMGAIGDLHSRSQGQGRG